KFSISSDFKATPTLLLSFLISASLLISLSNSLACTSQTFKSKKVFSNCTDLPYLKSFLHFTYNSTNSSLSIGFISPLAKPEGWVAWAINPTGTGMIGSQALIAFQSNGSLIVNTYNISMFPQQSKLSFDVWDLSTESDGKKIVIFTTVKVPEGATTVNQVWQVGPSVSKGVPDKHEMGEANKKYVGVLKFAGGGAPAPAPTAVPAPAHGPKPKLNFPISLSMRKGEDLWRNLSGGGGKGTGKQSELILKQLPWQPER
ncbi:auxin-induced in root cultures protein 12-like, partial [Euphorbia lathyris]|uniref:auxin-induced in root cultures protein 12-like n=1 Tax=Euphorbia lathyris TaxID=212925 RepID=UPI0033132EFF